MLLEFWSRTLSSAQDPDFEMFQIQKPRDFRGIFPVKSVFFRVPPSLKTSQSLRVPYLWPISAVAQRFRFLLGMFTLKISGRAPWIETMDIFKVYRTNRKGRKKTHSQNQHLRTFVFLLPLSFRKSKNGMQIWWWFCWTRGFWPRWVCLEPSCPSYGWNLFWIVLWMRRLPSRLGVKNSMWSVESGNWFLFWVGLLRSSYRYHNLPT